MAKEPVEKNFPLSKERVQKMLEGLPGGVIFRAGDKAEPSVPAIQVRRIELSKKVEDPEEEEMLDPEEMMREIRLLRSRIEDLEAVVHGGLPSSKKDQFSKLLRDFNKLSKKVGEIERQLPPGW